MSQEDFADPYRQDKQPDLDDLSRWTGLSKIEVGLLEVIFVEFVEMVENWELS